MKFRLALTAAASVVALAACDIVVDPSNPLPPPADPAPADPAPADPAPVDPAPTSPPPPAATPDPAPADPAPAEPAPADPVPADPAPEPTPGDDGDATAPEPAPGDPAPDDPTSADPAPGDAVDGGEPAPADPAPAEPAPGDASDLDPAPGDAVDGGEPAPADPAPAEPADPTPGDAVDGGDPAPADPPADPDPAPIDPTPADPAPSDPAPADPAPADPAPGDAVDSGDPAPADPPADPADPAPGDPPADDASDPDPAPADPAPADPAPGGSGGPGFTYIPVGDLIDGSGVGSADRTVYAPDIVFPVRDAKTYINSQVYRPGGSAVGGDQCDVSNFSYPWRDNFCETRSSDRKTLTCPRSRVHQGQDLRGGDPAMCREMRSLDLADNTLVDVVALEDGYISYIGKFTVNLRAGDRIYRYMHLNMQALEIEYGQTVQAGDLIGYLSRDFGGAPTTFHLHLEFKFNMDGVGWTWVNPYMSLVRAYERSDQGGPGTPVDANDG